MTHKTHKKMGRGWRQALALMISLVLLCGLVMPAYASEAAEVKTETEVKAEVKTEVKCTCEPTPEGHTPECAITKAKLEKAALEESTEKTEESTEKAGETTVTAEQETVVKKVAALPQGTTLELNLEGQESATEQNQEQKEEQTQPSVYEQLMAAENCYAMLDIINENPQTEFYALTADQLDAWQAKVEAMEDDGAQDEILDTIALLKDNVPCAECGETGGEHADGCSRKIMTYASASGTFSHIEIEIAGKASLTIDGQQYEKQVTITTQDNFTMSAYKLVNGNKVPYTDFTFSRVTNGNGSTQGATVELTGSYPTGTNNDPVYYVVTLVKDVTFTLNDGTQMTVPVTMEVTTYYWDSNNHCPGVQNSRDWKNGYYAGNGSGIDVPVSGEIVGQAITKGKMAIKKVIFGDTSDQESFTFTIQNSAGEYLVFNDTKYTGTTSNTPNTVTVKGGETITFTDIPVDTYTITEIQKDGYVITNVDGQETGNYTVDYTTENKTDDDIPVATFTNKKLTNEAAISIKKTASGLGSGTYPNPTLSIYEAGSDGKPTGEPVWTGTLKANGDTIYPKVELDAGQTYVVVETNQDAEDYTCTTSLSGSGVSGMTFTAAAATRHDLVVNNTYTAKPKITSVTISKTVTGGLGDKTKNFSFTVTVKKDEVNQKFKIGDTEYTGTATFTLHDDQTITLNEVPIGATVTVTETSYADKGYSTTYSINGSGTQTDGLTAGLTAADGTNSIAFTNAKNDAPDTGVLLDSLPYVLILVAVVAGVALMLAHKRRSRFDD